MPRDGSGNFTLVPGYLAIAGQIIQPSQHNPPLEDIAQALTNSLPRNGSAGMLADLPMGGFRVTGLAAGVSPNDAATIAQLGANYRNRAINSASQISQERGTTAVDVTTGASYVIDQVRAVVSTTPGGTLRGQQVAGFTPAGTPNFVRFTAHVADASLVTGDYYGFDFPYEGNMVADARFGLASAQQVIKRFAFRSSIAGTFHFFVQNGARNRSRVLPFTIGAPEINTWVTRTFVIPPDTAGTWSSDTGLGMICGVTLAAGTTFNGTAGAWQAGDVRSVAGATNFMATGAATFDVSEVGLYVDPLNVGTSPPWEMPPVDDSLRSLQRYYSRQIAVARFNAPAGGAVMETPVYWPALMRVAPVISGPVGASTTNVSSSGVASATLQGCRFFIVAAAAGDALSNGGIVTADARF